MISAHILVLFVSFVMEYITIHIYIMNSFKRRTSAFTFFPATAGMYAALFLFSIADNAILNTVLFTLVNFLILWYFTVLKPLYALFQAVILTVTMAAMEFITLLICQRYSSDFYNENYFLVNQVGIMIISKLLFFFVIIAASVFNRHKSESMDMSYSVPFFLLIVPIISIAAILGLTVLWLGNYSYISNMQVNVLIPVITLLIVILNALVFVNEYQRRKKYSETTELQLRLQNENNLSNYYQTVLKEYEDRSIIIHDMKNHLQSILDLNKDNPDIDNYIQDILDSPAFKPSVIRSDNDMLNAIVTRYYERSEAENIIFTTDIRHNVVNFMQNEDITALFCNILDNAFDACEESKEAGTANIDLRVDKKIGSEFTIVKLSNTSLYDPISPETGLLNSTNKTDKRNHGFGSKSVQYVADKYDGTVQYTYDKDNKLFSVSVLLMNRQKPLRRI